jgi:hypothetical protein
MRWAGHVARIRERRGTCGVLVGKPEGKRILGKPRRILENNIKIDLQEIVWGTWTGFIWLRTREIFWAFFEHSNKQSGSI